MIKFCFCLLLTIYTFKVYRLLIIDGVRINQLNLGWVLSENEKALQITEGQATDWFSQSALISSDKQIFRRMKKE